MATKRGEAATPTPGLFGAAGMAPAAPVERARRRAPRVSATPSRAAASAPAPPPALPIPVVAEGTPRDRAWARVGAECPDGRSVADHREGTTPFVHITTMVRHEAQPVVCLPGEEVHGYPGFYRPVGGPHRFHEVGAVIPTEEDVARNGAQRPPTYPTRKTFPYVDAEKTGR